MIRAVADALFDTLIDAFPPKRAYHRADVERAPMPPPIAHFLTQALARRADLEEEHLREARSNGIDYEAAEVQQAHDALVEAFRNHVRIPQADWTSELQQAAQQVTAYLVTPVSTLVAFVFQDEHGALPVSVIEQRLGYFSSYSYLQEIIASYVEREDVDALERTRFAGLLRRIDREMVEDYRPDQWMRLLDPLFDLMQAVPTTSGNAVPRPLLHAFFDSKDTTRFARRLAQHNAETLRPEALRRLLETTDAAPDDTQQPAASSPSTDEPDPSAADEPAPDEPVPLWKKFRAPAAPPSPGASRTGRRERPSQATPPPAESDDEATPRWKQFRPDLAPSDDQLASLERAVLGTRGRKNRSLFVNQLFDGSADAYKQTLQKLRQASGWAQASKLIGQEVFKKHHANIYSDAAVTFTDAVQSRYQN